MVGVLPVEVIDDSNTLQSPNSEPAPLLPPCGTGGTDDDDVVIHKYTCAMKLLCIAPIISI